MTKHLFFSLVLLNGVCFSAGAESINNPCDGDAAILNLIDRPTNASSACLVPFNKAMLETGFQYGQLSDPDGRLTNMPEGELRLGLPAHNELILLIPNYVHQSISPHSGFTAMSLGLKHMINSTENWVATIEVIFTPAGGSDAFGSSGSGASVNGIFSYNFNPKLNVSLMIGGSTTTDSSYSGGNHFESFNPDGVLTYALHPKLNVYGELYGQTKTAANAGSGFNIDGGFIYLLRPNITIDLEYGHQIVGELGISNSYVGSGIAFLF